MFALKRNYSIKMEQGNLVFKLLKSILLLLTIQTSCSAQFAPAVGIAGSDALSFDSPLFKNWASGCEVKRGYQNKADTTLGYTDVGENTDALGKAGENGVLSLGDGGEAVLTFPHPIKNGIGPDFAVFENGFSFGGVGMAFLELAFVEVSSDGSHFVRFPATSHTQDTTQLAMEGMDASLLHNLAGKYVFRNGTPFDLAELKDSLRLDINRITHIKLVDVVGSIDERFASYDIEGNKINDPFPTPFPSSGFDLDAVGVINEITPSGLETSENIHFSVFPNPVSNVVYFSEEVKELLVLNELGQVVFWGNELNHLNVSQFSEGVYVLEAKQFSGFKRMKIVVQH